ncbi:MAG: class I mannose-6-phosphate isomerase, partial [Lachnospiraceae bacterium]|nr:class I mannose-6-phosphate isomerase [Lachnospiraceae bacterium]
RMVEEKRWDDLINRVPVKKGDFIRLDPGTLHAITAGVMLLEVQENSDVTYRVYDYDRLQNGKPRQLHIQQSLDVLRVPDHITTAELIHTGGRKNELQLLAATSRVKVWTLSVSGSCRIDVPHWQIASILEGEGSMNGTAVRRGEHLIIPGDCGGLVIEGEMRVNLAQARGG